MGLKQFADGRVNVVQMMISVFEKLENFIKKEENAGFLHFLVFQQCFKKSSLLGLELCWEIFNHFFRLFQTERVRRQ